MVAITFCGCFCLLFVTVEELISISMSHAWRPPSHSFFLVCVTRLHVMRLAALFVQTINYISNFCEMALRDVLETLANLFV